MTSRKSCLYRHLELRAVGSIGNCRLEDAGSRPKPLSDLLPTARFEPRLLRGFVGRLFKCHRMDAEESGPMRKQLVK